MIAARPSPAVKPDTRASGFGCTTAINLGPMMCRPADLAEDRPLRLAGALPAISAMPSFQSGKTQPSSTTIIGQIGAIVTQAPGAAGGGAGGSQP
jgi:hypothetical protein